MQDATSEGTSSEALQHTGIVFDDDIGTQDLKITQNTLYGSTGTTGLLIQGSSNPEAVQIRDNIINDFTTRISVTSSPTNYQRSGNSGDFGSAVYNPASLAASTGTLSGAISVPNAELGDSVTIGAPYDMQGIIAHGYVSSATFVKIALWNGTGSGPIDLASGTWKVNVQRLK